MNKVLFFLFFALGFVHVQAQSQEQDDQTMEIVDRELAEEIETLYAEQEALIDKKNEAIRRGGFQALDKVYLDEKTVRFIQQDIESCKDIFYNIGLPSYSLVGKEAAEHFWEIVIRLDDHPKFQEDVLKEMQMHVDGGLGNEISMTGFAHLKDRCAINKGLPQVYGTQLFYDEEKQSYTHHNVDDMSKVAARRAEAGLPPLKASIQKMNKRYLGNLKNGNIQVITPKRKQKVSKKVGKAPKHDIRYL